VKVAPRPSWFALRAVAAVACFGAVASATTPRDFVPARAMAMGASRGAASGNEAIFLNPAAVGAMRRYSLQLDYAHATGTDSGDGFVLSIVDSLSNPQFPTGLAYRYASVGEGADKVTGTTKDFALGFALGDSLLLGTRVTYITYAKEGHDFSQFTGDLGVLAKLGGVNVGATGYNLLRVDSQDVSRGFATGIGIGDDRSYLLAADLRWDWPQDKAMRSWSVAGEYLFGDALALRAGYSTDAVRGTAFWSTGLGLITQSIGLDVGYRHDLHTREGLWGFAVKVFGG
jgi:hypothetical protein